MARMKILTRHEVAEFESPPKFNSAERKRFFSVSLAINELLAILRTPANQVCFLILVGYFRTKRKFFMRPFSPADIEFVTHQIVVSLLDVNVESYDRATYLRYQELILQHFGYQAFDKMARTFTLAEIQALVRVQHRPKFIFLETVQTLTRKKITLPSYNVLAYLIIKAINQHQQHLSDIIITTVNQNQREKLDTLLKKEANSDGDLGWRYQLTSFKAVSHSTRPAKIKENVSDLIALQVLYLEFKPIIARLNLSAESIRHYAYLVIKSQVPQFLQRSSQVRYLYLIAFIAYQTFKLTDILTDTLLSSVQNVLNLTQRNQQERYFKERTQRSQAFAQLQAQLATIRQILSNKELDNQQKIGLIDTALATESPSEAEKYLQNGQEDFDELETLLKALEYYQTHDSTLDKNAPVAFLEAKEREVLNTTDGQFRISLYKVLLFIKTAQAIKSGAINLLHSAKYRSLDDYLIPKADWEANREKYLERASLNDFADCKATLNALETKLDERYQRVNQRFKSGENQYLTLRTDGTAHVKTPRQEAVESPSLATFFPERKYISMLEMLATVNQSTDFLSEFEHWQSK